MPGRGDSGRVRGGEKGHGNGRDNGLDEGGPADGGPLGSSNNDHNGIDGPGRSNLSPGHRKRAAGEQSAREFAPAHGRTSPGRQDRD